MENTLQCNIFVLYFLYLNVACHSERNQIAIECIMKYHEKCELDISYLTLLYTNLILLYFALINLELVYCTLLYCIIIKFILLDFHTLQCKILYYILT